MKQCFCYLFSSVYTTLTYSYSSRDQLQIRNVLLHPSRSYVGALAADRENRWFIKNPLVHCSEFITNKVFSQTLRIEDD